MEVPPTVTMSCTSFCVVITTAYTYSICVNKCRGRGLCSNIPSHVLLYMCICHYILPLTCLTIAIYNTIVFFENTSQVNKNRSAYKSPAKQSVLASAKCIPHRTCDTQRCGNVCVHVTLFRLAVYSQLPSVGKHCECVYR